MPCGAILKDAGRGVENRPRLASMNMASGVRAPSSATSYSGIDQNPHSTLSMYKIVIPELGWK